MKKIQVKKSLTELSLAITPLKNEEIVQVTGGMSQERNYKDAARRERTRK